VSDQGVLLRKAVADFFAVDEAEVGPAFRLSGPRGASSITRAALDAALRRRVGVRSQSVYTARTFGELAAELDPATAPTHPARDPADAVRQAPSPAPDTATGVGCGVDLELVENLPYAADCWADPFYQATFSPAEVAYCLVQPEPAPHFCARWCAKEALKKCDPSFATAELKDIEVAHGSDGAPHLVDRRGGAVRRLPYSLSLSHTPLAAVAVVVRFDDRQAPPPAPPLSTTPEDGPPPTLARRGGALQTLLALAAFVLAALAFYRTFPGAH
jgi:phosphopantetheinyl transferase (holo-ACP synthase)